MFSPSSLMASLFGQNGEGIQSGLGQSGTQNSGDTQQNLQGPMAPTVQPTGPKVVQKVSGSSSGGGGFGLPLGPLYNIPEALSRGDWGDVMKDGALGPIGAAYNIANGKDALKSVMNSFGPAGQLPYLLGSGQMPYSGGNTSKNFMSAFQGRGV